MTALLDRVDAKAVAFLSRWSIVLLRISLGTVFVWFGALKVLDVTPVSDLVGNTVYWVDPDWFVPVLGVAEIAIGVGLVLGMWLRSVLALFLLGYELPIRPDVVGAGHLGLPRLQSVAAETVGHVAEPLAQVGNLVVQCHEHHAAPRGDPHLVQPVVASVERTHVAHVEHALLVLGDLRPLEQRGADERAVEVVGPGVVRAADAPAQRTVLGDQLGAAVPAHVAEGPQPAQRGYSFSRVA